MTYARLLINVHGFLDHQQHLYLIYLLNKQSLMNKSSSWSATHVFLKLFQHTQNVIKFAITQEKPIEECHIVESNSAISLQ